MTRPPWREYAHGLPADPVGGKNPQATTTDPKITKLYGPDGKVLRTYSDRPPIGFHSAALTPQEPA